MVGALGANGVKPVRIQFVERRTWKAIWLVTSGALMVIAGFTGWQVWQQLQIRQNLQVELDRLQTKLKARSVPMAPTINPREASEKNAELLLKRDWNRLFDTIENPDLSSVRLVQLMLDAETGDARLEYELENMTQGSSVTFALNAFDRSNVWQLERLVSGGGGGGAGNTTGAKVRGIWRAQLE